MQNELDDQAHLLEDLGREMDTADSRMGTVMKKLTKVLHLGSGIENFNFISQHLGFLIFIFVV